MLRERFMANDRAPMTQRKPLTDIGRLSAVIAILLGLMTETGHSQPAPQAVSSEAPPQDNSGVETVITRMQDLQIMLGDWKGTTQRNVGRFKGLSETHWVWDFQSTPENPFLEYSSVDDHYLRSAKLYWDDSNKQYRLQATDQEGKERVLTGAFKSEPERFTNDSNQESTRYQLELEQIQPATGRDVWRLVFNQQDNDRILLEIHRKVGARFQRVDTVAYQRQGTSFAKSDEGYGEKECVISSGLGVTQVQYQGVTYWVCCTGCLNAFNQEPERWIAAFNKKKNARK